MKSKREICDVCGHPLASHTAMDSEPTLMCMVCAEEHDQRVCGIPISNERWEALLKEDADARGEE